MFSTPWFLKKTARLERIIRKHVRVFVPHDLYGPLTSPRLWRAVFIDYFGEEPKDNNDPRWDTLFKEGFPLARKCRKNPPTL